MVKKLKFGAKTVATEYFRGEREIKKRSESDKRLLSFEEAVQRHCRKGEQ